MVGVEEEQDIESLLKDWVGGVIFLAQVVHLVQEGARVAQAAWWRHEVTPLANAVRHSNH